MPRSPLSEPIDQRLGQHVLSCTSWKMGGDRGIARQSGLHSTNALGALHARACRAPSRISCVGNARSRNVRKGDRYGG